MRFKIERLKTIKFNKTTTNEKQVSTTFFGARSKIKKTSKTEQPENEFDFCCAAAMDAAQKIGLLQNESAVRVRCASSRASAAKFTGIVTMKKNI